MILDSFSPEPLRFTYEQEVSAKFRAKSCKENKISCLIFILFSKSNCANCAQFHEHLSLSQGNRYSKICLRKQRVTKNKKESCKIICK